MSFQNPAPTLQYNKLIISLVRGGLLAHCEFLRKSQESGLLHIGETYVLLTSRARFLASLLQCNWATNTSSIMKKIVHQKINLEASSF